MPQTDGEHDEAQAAFGKALGDAIEIPLFKHPILRWRAFTIAYEIRETHKKCCKWPSEYE